MAWVLVATVLVWVVLCWLLARWTIKRLPVKRWVCPARAGVAALLFGFSALMVFALLWHRQQALDRQMASLCASEGGVTVVRRAELPAKGFDATGALRLDAAAGTSPSWLTRQTVAGMYLIETRSIAVQAGDPVTSTYPDGRMLRWETVVSRLGTPEILGWEVSYSRVRGGMTASEGGERRCGSAQPGAAVVRAVFARKE